MDMYTAVKNRIQELLQQNNMSIYKLSVESAVPASTIKNILYGKSKNAGIITLKMICDGFNITINDFFDTDMNIAEAVKKRIEELCDERNLNFCKLANISGVPYTTVKSIIYGQSKNPSIATIKMLCDGFEISITDFFDTDTFRNLEQEIK